MGTTARIPPEDLSSYPQGRKVVGKLVVDGEVTWGTPGEIIDRLAEFTDPKSIWLEAHVITNENEK